MSTAAQFIKTALQLILVQGSEADLEAAEFASGVEYLNDMMAEWDGAGVSLGFTIIKSLGDEVTVPAFANMAIKQGLAVRLGPEFGGLVSPLLDRNAANSYKMMLNAAIEIGETSFQSTLPMGSGNTGSRANRNTAFYPSEADQILTETGGTILLQDQGV